MTTPFLDINEIRSDVTYIEEILPQSYRQPESESVKALYNDRIDLLAIRVYGTNHSTILRSIIWANSFNLEEWMSPLEEGLVIATPPIRAVYYTRSQSRI